ncbi:hypothetical protein ACSBR1_005307 [Camellia fascicularis]
MVVELDLAVELRLDYRNELGGSGDRVELVAAEEIERAVRCVMDGEKESKRDERKDQRGCCGRWVFVWFVKAIG